MRLRVGRTGYHIFEVTGDQDTIDYFGTIDCVSEHRLYLFFDDCHFFVLEHLKFVASVSEGVNKTSLVPTG